MGVFYNHIYGLVQTLCIEYNIINTVETINANHLTLLLWGNNLISLDQAIISMKEIGEDLNTDYQETSQGSLALNYTQERF